MDSSKYHGRRRFTGLREVRPANRGQESGCRRQRPLAAGGCRVSSRTWCRNSSRLRAGVLDLPGKVRWRSSSPSTKDPSSNLHAQTAIGNFVGGEFLADCRGRSDSSRGGDYFARRQDGKDFLRLSRVRISSGAELRTRRTAGMQVQEWFRRSGRPSADLSPWSLLCWRTHGHRRGGTVSSGRTSGGAGGRRKKCRGRETLS